MVIKEPARHLSLASHTVPAGYENETCLTTDQQVRFGLLQAKPHSILSKHLHFQLFLERLTPQAVARQEVNLQTDIQSWCRKRSLPGIHLRNSGPGDAIETQIYYRTLGDTGWSTYWALCNYADATTPASNPPCAGDEDYTSEDDVIFQELEPMNR